MPTFNKDGIKVVQVENPDECEDFAKNFLYENMDAKTVLFLSGGKTPKSLYDQILIENKLKAGAFAMIDERYGDVGHEKSNALMMKYFSPLYPILTGASLEETSAQYDETLRYLFNNFPKSLGILGIGFDGHTAGIPAIPKITEKILDERNSLVTFYDASDGFYDQRITMTFAGLSKLDQILIMAFGEDKKEALGKMFKDGPITEVPARFYLQPEISKKTILITDQKI